ncbi:MAG: Trk system potassium transporter TrkA [bacterium]
MKIVIVGAGQVGSSVAEQMIETNEVIVVDNDFKSLDNIPYNLEVVHGDGTSMEILKEAGVGEADVLVAGTNADRTNILICSTGKIIAGNIYTIARVKSSSYLQTWKYGRNAFGVDFMLARSYLAGRSIAKLIGYRSARETARDIAYFADRSIQMAEFDVPENSPLAHNTVRRADRFEGLTFGAIFRDEEMIIPHGSEEIKPGDRLVAIGEPDAVRAFGMEINPEESRQKIKSVVIFGGGEVGYQTARLLSEKNIDLRIVEADGERARYLAEQFPDALVLHGNGLDYDFWEEEQLQQADMHIVALHPDGKSLLVALQSKRSEAGQVISVVQEQANVSLFEEAGIDLVVHPREVIVEDIIRSIKRSYAENIASIVHHRGEVFELKIKESSPIRGKKIKDIVSSFPEPLVVGAIRREEKVIVPRGDTEIKTGDRVVMLAETDAAEDIAREI